MFDEHDLDRDLSEKQYLDALRKIDLLDGDSSRKVYFNYLRAHVCRMLGALDQAADICRKGGLATSTEFTYLQECFTCAFHAQDWKLLAAACDSILDIGLLPLDIRPGLFFGVLSVAQREKAKAVRDSLIKHELTLGTSNALRDDSYRDWVALDTPIQGTYPSRRDLQRVAIFVLDESISEHVTALAEQLEAVVPNLQSVQFNDSDVWHVGLISELQKFEPDLILLQQPYLEKFPTSFTESEFVERTVNFGYGPMLAGDDYFFGNSGGQFGFGGYLRGGLTLVHHPAFRDRFRLAGVHESRLLEAGDPLTWKLRAELQDPVPQRSSAVDLLWAPHWTSTNWTGTRAGYSNVNRDLEIILRLAANNVKIKIRAHPHLTKILAGGLQSDLHKHHRVFTEDFVRKWQELTSLRNVTLSDDTMSSDVLTARTMLTDGVSIIHYWALTGKPIAVSRNERSPGFAQQGSGVLEHCAMTSNAYSVERWFDNAMSSNRLNLELIESTFDLVADFGDSPGALLSQHFRR